MASTKTKKEPRAKASDNLVYQKIKRENERFIGAAKEIQTQYREFTIPGDGDDRVVRVYFPPPAVESTVNQTYAKTYGRLLQDDDFLPESQILEMMKKRGVWSDKDDEKIEALKERLARLRNTIWIQGETNMTAKEMEETAEDYSKTEMEMNRLIGKRASFTVNSIETRAYETKMKDQVWQCVKLVVDGKERPLWSSLEEIDNEIDRVLLLRVINECTSFWQGVPSDFLDDSLETPSGEPDMESPKAQDTPSSESQSLNGEEQDSTS